MRLGWTGDISALGGGASWIWDIIRLEFGKVRECLDVYHALEHLGGIGKLFYGEESAAQKKWYESAKEDLLSGGYTLREASFVVGKGGEYGSSG